MNVETLNSNILSRIVRCITVGIRVKIRTWAKINRVYMWNLPAVHKNFVQNAKKSLTSKLDVLYTVLVNYECNNFMNF